MGANPDFGERPGDTLSSQSLLRRPDGSFAVPKGYIAGLDGLRAVAVVLVFLFHAKVPGFGAGFFGVDVFFVLSGFLITSLLLEEVAATGAINFTRFIRRRLVRLVPALVVMVLTFALLAPFFPDVVEAPYIQSILALSYLSDYGSALLVQTGELSHTWSLAVEAKFYLIWPVFLLCVLRRVGLAKAWRVILLAAFIATSWRILNAVFVQGWNVSYYRFDTRLSGLSLGAALAAVLWSSHGQRLVQRAAGLVILPCLALLLLPMAWGDTRLLVIGCTLVEVGSAVVILAVLGQSGRWVQFMALPLISGLGRLSYGFYLWHYPIIRWMRDDWDWPVIAVVAFPLALLLAWLSHVTVERFALRFRGERAILT